MHVSHSRIGALLCLYSLALLVSVFAGVRPAMAQEKAGDAALGTQPYDKYETPAFCGTACHMDFYQQWKQAMMSQATPHQWDEIEYFKLAVPHAEKDPKVAGVKAGCNGCHAPMAFLAGDVPPPKPEAGSRANESVSCDVCHTISGFEGDTPHNFNWVSEPGKVKYGRARRAGLARARDATDRRSSPRPRLLRHMPQRKETRTASG